MVDYSKIQAILATKPNSQAEAIERDRLERTITSYREVQLLKTVLLNKDRF